MAGNRRSGWIRRPDVVFAGLLAAAFFAFALAASALEGEAWSIESLAGPAGGALLIFATGLLAGWLQAWASKKDR